MRIIYGESIENLTAGSITASTEANGFEVENIQTNSTVKTWRSTALTAQTITLDFITAKTLDSIAIINHNCTASAEFLIQANTANTWTSVLLSSSLTYNSYLLADFFTSTSARWWRLSITDTTNTDAYIEVGKLKLEAYLSVDPSFNIEIVEAHERTDTISYSQGGQLYADEGINQRSYQLQFPYASETMKDSLVSMFGSVGLHQPIVVCMHNDTFTTFNPVYCHITDVISFTYKTTAHWEYNINIKELY